ncbi:hypothetical protein CSUB01_12398 [Colletotrichum sublineola]|uniref:BZIP domain-containing protein n=1 Tax=Colletotrichum sublineola TaxID=1173701 RepID=A0A066XVJ7_COLSU|nr:hypothetical protein CSUB01_12398 [Colletotrichum sublineola]
MNPLIPPTENYSYQQWPVWDDRSFDYVCFSGDPAIGEPSQQWDTEDQAQQQQPNVLGTVPHHVMTGSGTNSWQCYQHDDGQSTQNVLLTPSPCWSVSSWPGFPPTPAAWQPLLDCQSPQYAGSETSTREIKKNALGTTQVMTPGESVSSNSSSYFDENSRKPYQDGRKLESDTSSRPDRRKTYRINNRAAAKRCREKTKQQELDLVAIDRHVTEERMYLDACVASLKDEVLSLRNTILQHSDCDCEAIKRYISNAAGDLSLGMKPTARSSMGGQEKEAQIEYSRGRGAERRPPPLTGVNMHAERMMYAYPMGLEDV